MNKDIIYKYALEIGAENKFLISESHRILSLQVDGKTNKPTLWIMEQVDTPKREFQFEILTTGMPFCFRSYLGYVGTFQLSGGDFVGHVFRRFYL